MSDLSREHMKLLIVTPIFPPKIGGPATYVFELCERLRDKYELTIISFGTDLKPLQGVKIIGLPIHYPRWGMFRRQLRLFFSILKNGLGSKIIYAQGPDVVGLASMFTSLILRKKLMVKFVGDAVWETAFSQGKTKKLLDDFLASPNSGILDKCKIWLQKLVMKVADKVVVPSHYLGEVLRKYYGLPRNKIQVVYNAFSLKKEVKLIFKKKEKSAFFHLVTISRLVRHKNVDGILHAISLLKDIFPLKLSIIGEGPELKKLRKLSIELGIAQQTQFLGKLPHSKSLAILSRSHLFILNSLYEGLPHTLLEAMFLKIPVVATNIPGTTEVAIDRKTALLVKANDYYDLADKIKIMLSDVDLREKFKSEGLKLVTGTFSWDAHIKSLGKIW